MSTAERPATRDITLPLSTYQLSALRLLVQADIDRTARDNPHPGPGPDPRVWPTAMREIAAMLDSYSTTPEATTALAAHYLTEDRRSRS